MNKASKCSMFIALMVTVAICTGCPSGVDGNSTEIATSMNLEVKDDGEVLIKGNLFGAAGIPEGDGLSARMQREIRIIAFDFFVEDAQGNLDWRGYTAIEVEEDGTTNGTAGFLDPEVNYASVYCLDWIWRSLFHAEPRFTLVPGGATKVQIDFSLVEKYQYRFVILDLPGDYGQNGNAKILTDDGETIAWWWKNELNEMMFDVTLDLYFNGGSLTIIDLNDKAYAAVLKFDIFDALDAPDGTIYLKYVPDPDLARLDFISLFPLDEEETVPVPLP